MRTRKRAFVAGFATRGEGFPSQGKSIAAATTFALSASWNGPNTSLDAQFVARDFPTFAGSLCPASFLSLGT